MIDINTIFNNAITNAVINTVNAAIAQATQPLVERIATLEQQLKTITEQPKSDATTAVDMDALRELVTPLVASIVVDKIDSVVDQAIQGHCEDYDHDNYDEIAEKVDGLSDLDEFVKNDDLPDFDDFVTHYSLEDKVREVVGNLTFEVSVN